MYSCQVPKEAITTMGPMRQRLLLVAGWAAAAVVASLVSTGAVAVAGGQVIDQPRSPLSASEVAALTEECGLSDRAPCLRQLDNSVDPTTTVEAAPEKDLGLEGDEQGVSPVLPVDDTEPPSEDPLDPGVEVDESLVPAEPDPVPEPRAEVVEMTGGRASVSGAEGEVKIIWAIPNAGFALLPPSGSAGEEAAVSLVFSDGSHQSTLVATWDPSAGLTVETIEGPFDLTES